MVPDNPYLHHDLVFHTEIYYLLFRYGYYLENRTPCKSAFKKNTTV